MTVTEQIIQHVQGLPETIQVEILDFIGYLETKVRGNPAISDEKEWTILSLSSAMKGMEDEQSPYSVDDIKESFS